MGDANTIVLYTHKMSEKSIVVSTAVPPSTLKRLLADKIFLDFFNKYLCLPVFPVMTIYRGNRFQIYPPLEPFDSKVKLPDHYDQLFNFILEERLPFFFKSPIYIEYQLCKLLTSSLLFGDDKKFLTDLQMKTLGSMEKMYNFKIWLKRNSPIGLLFYTFWLDCQAALIIHYQEKYEEQQSPFCLPKNVLKDSESYSKSCGEFSISVQAKALRHLQYYFMPQYLIHHSNNSKNHNESFSEEIKKFVNRSFQDVVMVTSQSVTDLALFDVTVAKPSISAESVMSEDQRNSHQMDSTELTKQTSVIYSLKYKGELSKANLSPEISTDDLQRPRTVSVSKARDSASRPRSALSDPDFVPRKSRSASMLTKENRRTSVLPRNLSIIARRDSKHQEFYQSKSVFSRMTISQNKKNPLPAIRKDSNNEEFRRRSSQAKESNTSLPYHIRDRSNSNLRKDSIAQKRRQTMTQRRGTISVKKLDNSQERENLLKKITSMDTLSAVIRTKNKLKKSVLNTVMEEKETKDDFVKTTRQAMATAKAIKKFSKKKKDTRSFRKGGPKTSLMDTNATTVRFRLADEQGNMKMSRVGLHDTLTPRETVTE